LNCIVVPIKFVQSDRGLLDDLQTSQSQLAVPEFAYVMTMRCWCCSVELLGTHAASVLGLQITSLLPRETRSLLSRRYTVNCTSWLDNGSSAC
jgi:hypothetical protein